MTVAARSFATQGRVATIDVLPLDLEMWAEPGYQVNLADLRAQAEVNLMNVALETLAKRSYSVGATIDWNGDYPGGNALAKDDLIATVGSLAGYGAAATERPGELPVPFLPARLGTTTGADATLYVGGWSYVAEPRESSGNQVAEGIVIALIVISVVALVAMALSGSKSSSHGTGHGKSHGHASSFGHGGSHARAPSGGGGHVSGALYIPSSRDAVKVGRAVSWSHGAGSLRHAGRFHHVASFRRTARAVGDLVDAFGRTAIEVEAAAPDWDDDPALPRSGSQSQMYLEMTLVDNHTGLVLWHAHQTFPADAGSTSETARVARLMLSRLPDRASQAATASN